ncbi:MAG: kinase/pyrophosphorylase [Proteobacteria bacterium]|jgi:regulator of PEP synthase PpsR (kinase-PPPase family)|nr:kinase/pyrophosphorylase [Pseudomonadota bacterium]
MTPTTAQPFLVFLVSDGTGETVENIVHATLTQYSLDQNVKTVRYKSVRTKDQVDAILEEAHQKGAAVIYTTVSPIVREAIKKRTEELNILSVDLLGPMLDVMNRFLGTQPSLTPGLLHEINDKYFRRIEAMEFVVKQDDGSNPENLQQADLVLVGVSRTSKTPLSIYLSHKGYKVANVPLVKGISPPEELFKIDQNKIIALTIDPEALMKIRKERLSRMGRDPASEYASLQHIREELEWAREIFQRHRRWPLFDVTNKALEETASEIERLMRTRLKLS